VTKTWEELAKEAGGDSDFAKKLDGIPGKERASMGGPVAADTTYESWFAEQDRERQLEILGPGRMGMYERRVLGFSDIIDQRGNPLTVNELRTKHDFYVDKAQFREWYEKLDKAIGDDFVVDNLPSHIQKLLKTNAESLLIGPEFLDNPSHKERNITSETYVNLLNRIKDCTEIYQTRDFHIALVIETERPWVIILKTTQDYSKVYAATLHRLNEHSIKAFRKGRRVY
jgi:hypothetical protein